MGGAISVEVKEVAAHIEKSCVHVFWGSELWGVPFFMLIFLQDSTQLVCMYNITSEYNYWMLPASALHSVVLIQNGMAVIKSKYTCLYTNVNA